MSSNKKSNNQDLFFNAYTNTDLFILEKMLKSKEIQLKDYDLLNFIVDENSNELSFKMLLKYIDLNLNKIHMNYLFRRLIEDNSFSEATILLEYGFKISPKFYHFLDNIIEFNDLIFLKLFIKSAGKRLSDNLKTYLLITANDNCSDEIFDFLLTQKSLINSVDKDFLNDNFKSYPIEYKKIQTAITISSF
jgi:hypothetical protein